MDKQKPRILCTVSGTFPFDFFPNTLIVDEQKITLIFRDFFFQREVYALYYESIMSVTVDMGLFFATIKVLLAKSFPEKQPDPLSFVGKTQAEYVRKLIVGMIRLHQIKYDFEHSSAENIILSATNEGTDYLGLS